MTDNPQNTAGETSPNPEAPPTNPYADQPASPPFPNTHAAPTGVDGAQEQPWAQPGATPYGAGHAQPYGYAPALPEPPQATTVLVLGILSLLLGGITGPFAWVMGSKARRQIASGQYAQSSLLTVGWVLGIIGTLYLVVMVALVVFTLIVFIIALNQSGY